MPRPFGILVASDGSPSAQAALDTALAFPWPATSRARGVVALGPLKGFRASTRTALVRAVDETSRALQEALAERWPAAEALALHGAPAEAIVIESRRFRADVVVLGWRGHGRFRRLLAGSVSRSVAEKARCSVLVTRKAPSSVRRLVVGFDGTAASRAALRLAAKLEPPPGGRVFLAQVLEPILVMPRRLPAKTRATVRAELIRKERSRTRDAERGLEDAAGGLRRRGWKVTTLVRRGAPVAELMEVAGRRSAEALVVGASSGSRLQRVLLGSVAAAILDVSTVPVLIAR
ncbi:MAG TPA: universal stress protein [Burkholderiales bacterium]|nr:universal stress protein [Burkholderiales bacterium]